MFTVEDIINIMEMYYVKDGRVFIKNLNEEVLEEDTVLHVLAANLIFTEAETRYNDDLKLFGEKYVSNHRKYLEKMMQRFSVNGEETDLARNVFIRSLIASNGHYEEVISREGLDPKFSIFSNQKKIYGLAYLKLKLREKDLDTDDITLRVDMSDEDTAKVIIDFKIKPYVKVVQVYSDKETLENKKERRFEMPTNTDLNYIYEQISLAEKAGDRHMKEYWLKMLNANYGGVDMNYIIGELAKARKSHDNTTVEYWNTILNTVAPIEDITENSTETNSLEAFEELLKKLKSARERVKEKEDIEKIYTSVRAAIKSFDIDVMSDTWCRFSKDEKTFATTLMMQASILLDDRMRYDYWYDVYKSLTASTKPKEETVSLERFEAVLLTLEERKNKVTEETKEEYYSSIKKALNNYGSVFTNNSNWQKLNIKDKEYFARLMMKAGILLDDKEYETYWTGVHSVFAIDLECQNKNS